MKNAGLIFKVSLGLAAACLLLSCNALENKTQSASVLIVEDIVALSLDEDEVTYLQSDVVIEDPTTGQETIRADVGIATFRAELLNPNPTVVSSIYNDIQLNRYVVTYSQPNGNNIEGRDVPYSFEGSMSTLVPIGISVDVPFIVVRDVAKLEPPLYALRFSADTLQVRAKIDFYGKDMAGKSVKATGYLTIFFSNWLNE